MSKKRESGLPGLVMLSPKTKIPVSLGGAFLQPKQSAEESQEDKWAGPLPKGWTAKSRSKAYDSFSKAEEGPTTNCMNKIKGHVDDPGAFCGALRDRATGTTKWRSGGKKK